MNFQANLKFVKDGIILINLRYSNVLWPCRTSVQLECLRNFYFNGVNGMV